MRPWQHQHLTNQIPVVTNPKDMPLPYDTKKRLTSEWDSRYRDTVSIEKNERSLISNLLAKLNQLDPDLIVGHSLFGYQFEVILQRCQTLGINFWSRLGRLRRNMALPKVTEKSAAWLERMATAGRLICDTAVSARELVKLRSYDLHDLIEEILPQKFHCLHGIESEGDLSHLFSNSDGVKKLIDMTMDESISNLRLMHELQIIPLALEITSICGNLVSRTLCAGKAERNEFLLLHAFTESGYIVPDKRQTYGKPTSNETGDDNNAQPSKRKPAYLGGLVLEPKRGFYENFILLMDFNSLYPSIIREFNICFTTIDRDSYTCGNAGDGKDGDVADDRAPDLVELMNLSNKAAKRPMGILPNEIRKLVDSRTVVKQELAKQTGASAERRMQLDIRQKALKITANSMYGCLGFVQSRFRATQLAALVTCHGRDILMKTKDLVSSGSIGAGKKGNNEPLPTLDIIYGDTDSVMVDTGISSAADYDRVLRIGQRIKDDVNKLYKDIKLDIDGVLRRMLLLNKKKYAALTVVKKCVDNFA